MTAVLDPVAIAWAALSRAAVAADCPVTLVEGDAAPWWSATFAGDAIWLTIAAPASPAFERWCAALPQVEWSIPRRLVADCAVDDVERGSDRRMVTVSFLILDID